MPAGSGVVFDFAIDRKLLNPGQRIAADALARRVAEYGEPLQLFFDPGELQRELKGLGFGRTDFLDREKLECPLLSRPYRRLPQGAAAWGI